MAARDKTTGVKSAYELALERLESQGIARPRSEALSEETRARIADARSRAEAQLAELEILHKDALKRASDPTEIHGKEQEYREERRRVESELERKLRRLRQE